MLLTVEMKICKANIQQLKFDHGRKEMVENLIMHSTVEGMLIEDTIILSQTNLEWSQC